MPAIIVDLTILSDFEQEKHERRIGTTSKSKNITINLQKNQEYTLCIGTRRKNPSSLRVHCPKFHRGKDEGWFIVLGDIKRRELIALKRVSGVNGSRKKHFLQFSTPSSLGKNLNNFQIPIKTNFNYFRA